MTDISKVQPKGWINLILIHALKQRGERKSRLPPLIGKLGSERRRDELKRKREMREEREREEAKTRFASASNNNIK